MFRLSQISSVEPLHAGFLLELLGLSLLQTPLVLSLPQLWNPPFLQGAPLEGAAWEATGWACGVLLDGVSFLLGSV